MLLSLDAGGSSTKWAVYGPSAEPLGQGRLEPMSGHLFTAEDEQAMWAWLRQLAAQVSALSLPGPVEAVVAGITGLQVQAVPLLVSALARTFMLPTDRVRVGDDLELAYAAHFSPGEGVLVYAGTGSMAYHLRPGGEVVRAGGHGYLLGDEGGAFWQGQQALRGVLEHLDQGHRPEGPLARELAAVIGGLDWPRVRAYVYQGGRARLAALAPAVSRAAEAGDPESLAVMHAAGTALARLARTVLGRCPAPLPLVLAGGAVNPFVAAAFREALPGVALRPARPPVTGALRLSPLTRQMFPLPPEALNV